MARAPSTRRSTARSSTAASCRSCRASRSCEGRRGAAAAGRGVRVNANRKHSDSGEEAWPCACCVRADGARRLEGGGAARRGGQRDARVKDGSEHQARVVKFGLALGNLRSKKASATSPFACVHLVGLPSVAAKPTSACGLTIVRSMRRSGHLAHSEHVAVLPGGEHVAADGSTRVPHLARRACVVLRVQGRSNEITSASPACWVLPVSSEHAY